MLIFFGGPMHQSKNPFRTLSRFELCLWLVSIAVVTLSFLFADEKDLLTLSASLIGVTALIFVAKGYVIGQLLIVAFAVFYGFISFYQQYYGEMITYLGMSAPIAVMSVVSWLKNPYGDSKEVAVGKMTRKTTVLLFLCTAAVTLLFYFILRALDNASLLFSTLSVATSFLAASLTFLRSPYYAVAYAANDVVLIVLWITAAREDLSALPMIFCFSMFLINDIYGFISWKRMEKKQTQG